MPYDFRAEKYRVTTGSFQWTLSAFSGTDPNSFIVEPTGSITRSSDGALWKNTGGSTWASLSSGAGASADGSTLSSVTGVLNALPLSGTVDARFTNLSGTVDASIKAGLPVFDTFMGLGLRTTYDGALPLVVGGGVFDPTVVQTFLKASASFFFEVSAAAGTVDGRCFTQLWNRTDGYQICSASFSGSSRADLSIPLSTGGSASLHLPSSAKDYEVRVYVSGTSGATRAGWTVELYSARLRTRVSGTN